MKKSLSSAIALVAVGFSFAASAADLPRKSVQPAFAVPAFNWTGVYVGVDAGYLSSSLRVTVPALPAFLGTPSPSGFTYGAHIGYRYQFQNNVVLGIEARGFANSSTRKETASNFPPFNTRAELNQGGDLRLSLGYAIDRVLLYTTGGVAVIGGKGCLTAALGGPCVVGTTISDSSRVGWTLGAGAAYAFTNNWIARLDYSYSNFGNKNYTTPFVPGGITRTRLDTHAIRAGISYKF